MAIYHFSPQIASRSKGKNAVAMAAYRSGERLIDERTGEVKHYHRDVQPEAMILAPAHSPEWVYDRQRLWNEVELIEKAKNSQLCREITIALPIELSNEHQRDLLTRYVQEQFVDHGMVADVAIHRDNPGNPHAHVMLTMRPFNPDGTWGAKSKKEYVLDDKGEKIPQKSGGFKSYKVRTTDWDATDTLLRWREQWAVHSNRALEEAGLEVRIDHRSLEAQGITDRLPTVHEGPVVREMEQRGVRTEVGQINRDVKEHNAVVLELQKYREQKAALQEKKQLPPAQRAVLRQAAGILGQPASLESIYQKIQELQSEASRLEQSNAQLQKQLAPFEKAEIHFRNIKNWSDDLKGSSILSNAFNREARLKHAGLEKRISEARVMLEKLGFKDEGQFIARKEKVSAYVGTELAGMDVTRAKIDADNAVLREAEKVLKQVETQYVVDQYQAVPGIERISHPEAQAIQAVNRAAGRHLSADEIRATYSKRAGELQGLEQNLDQIRKNASRLHGAGQWLEKHEAQQAQLRKLFQSRQIKEKIKADLKVSGRMMKEFGVSDRGDYNRQLADHQQAELGKPAIEARADAIRPGVDLLGKAIRALDEVGRREQIEQRQQQWAKQQARVVQRSKDQEYER